MSVKPPIAPEPFPVNECVVLKVDRPDIGLQANDLGVVLFRLTYSFYEVEFIRNAERTFPIPAYHLARVPSKD